MRPRRVKKTGYCGTVGGVAVAPSATTAAVRRVDAAHHRGKSRGARRGTTGSSPQPTNCEQPYRPFAIVYDSEEKEEKQEEEEEEQEEEEEEQQEEEEEERNRRRAPRRTPRAVRSRPSSRCPTATSGR